MSDQDRNAHEGGAARGTSDGGGEAGSGAEGGARSARARMSEGFQRGLGVLSAFKDALEETIAEARERGDLSTDRAREAMRGAVDRAREATSEARERFDFVSQQEFDALERRVEALEARLADREGGGDTG